MLVSVLVVAAVSLAGCGTHTFRGVEEDVRAVGSSVGKGIESVGQSIQRKSSGQADGKDTDKGGTESATSAPASTRE